MALTGHPFTRIVTIVSGIVAIIVIVFLTQLTVETKEEITQLRKELRDAQQISVARVARDPFAALDQNCTWCHNERRYLGYHDDPKTTGTIVDRMTERAEIKLSDAELRQIHGAMDLIACLKCHDHHLVETFSALTSEKQKEVFDRMWKKPGSGLSRDDGTRISSALHAIQGF